MSDTTEVRRTYLQRNAEGDGFTPVGEAQLVETADFSEFDIQNTVTTPDGQKVIGPVTQRINGKERTLFQVGDVTILLSPDKERFLQEEGGPALRYECNLIRIKDGKNIIRLITGDIASRRIGLNEVRDYATMQELLDAAIPVAHADKSKIITTKFPHENGEIFTVIPYQTYKKDLDDTVSREALYDKDGKFFAIRTPDSAHWLFAPAIWSISIDKEQQDYRGHIRGEMNLKTGLLKYSVLRNGKKHFLDHPPVKIPQQKPTKGAFDDEVLKMKLDASPAEKQTAKTGLKLL